ncbi:MAG: glycosyltransferase [Planctomycetota bacterium]
MPTPPRITVILPCLDQGYYLERAVCSVLDQGYDNLELLVMDGGSADHSVEIIRTYEDQLEHWQSTWDSGPAEAVNTALTWATGDLVGVLDADDAYLPHALDEVARAFADDGVDWLVGQAVRIDETDEQLGELSADPPRSLASFLMSETGPLPGGATFYRTDLVKAMGGFDSTLRLAYAHEMHTRLYAADQKPTVTGARLAAVRDHDQSLAATHALAAGPEFIEAAERYATHLAPTHRYLLWRRHDEMRRLYAAAHEETAADPGQRGLWQQLLQRPWWLARNDYRRQLLQNLPSTAPAPGNNNLDTGRRHAA